MELAGYHETKRPPPKFYFVIHRHAVIKCLNFQVQILVQPESYLDLYHMATRCIKLMTLHHVECALAMGHVLEILLLI